MAGSLLSAILVLCLALLYIAKQKPSVELFDKLSDYYVTFVMSHALYAILVRCYFDTHELIDLIAPFGLAYGPFFYFGFNALITNKIDRKKVFLHFAPTAIFTGLFLVLISVDSLMADYLLSFYVVLYSLTAVSLLGYALWAVAFIISKSLSKKESYTKERAILLKSSGYLLVIMAGLFTVSVTTDILPRDEEVKMKLPAVMVYAGMLTSISITFRYKVKSVVTKLAVVKGVLKNSSPKETEPTTRELSAPQKYLKSGLSRDMFEDYKKRLDISFQDEQVFLDNSLTLEMLAKNLKMPPHHLTQLFNVFIGENFNQYMNRYRIEYAALLLENNAEGFTIEDIAFKSGFNNKVSFNRHFKNLMGCTPKEFVNNGQNDD